MKLGKGVPSVWPGYVAAVASLVLSLLLLLAILVFAMTQVQNMVAKYEKQIMQAALQDDIDQSKVQTQTPTLAPKPARQVSTAGAVGHLLPASPQSASETTRHPQLRLIFELGVADIPPATEKEMAQALLRMNATAGATWRISATTLVTDPVMEKNSYRLMLLVRDVLRKQNFKTNKIEISLGKSPQPPAGYERGEIVIQIEMIEPHNMTEASR